MSVHVLAGAHIVSSDTIPSLTRELVRLGNGVSRTAYDLGNGSVLKVGSADGFAGGNRSEFLAWQEIEGSEHEEHFARVIAADTEDFAWLIMERVDGTFSDYAHEEEWQAWQTIAWDLDMLGIGDLHRGNVGYVLGSDGETIDRILVIDYAWNQNRGNAGSDAYDDGHCATCCRGCSRGCSDKGRSDACCETIGRWAQKDCGTFAGCNARECDAPSCDRQAWHKICTIRNLEVARWFNAHNADHVWTYTDAIVCDAHKPRGMHTADHLREMAGQVPMFGRYFSRIV